MSAAARYLLVLALSTACVIGAAWAYVVAAPMAFLEGGYPAWAAKSAMLRDCRLGRIAFFGDSRLEAGVVPALLPVEASNFGVAAGTPLEVRSAVRRALECPQAPDQVVLSLTAEHFGALSRYFWIDTLRFGFITPGELLEAERLAATLGDRQTLTEARTADGMSGPARDWLYASRFPSIYFGSLVQGRLAGRLAANRARYQAVVAARGYSEYQSADALPDESHPSRYAPTPLQLALFEDTLRRLSARGIPVALLIMPSTPGTAPGPDYVAGLRGLAARYPGVVLLSDAITIWPGDQFADGVHLNGRGARLFTQRLAECLRDGRLQPGCDLAFPAASAAR